MDDIATLFEQECDDEPRTVLEVAQLWGDSIVEMTHFTRPNVVTAGQFDHCDFFAPAESLGGERTFPLVRRIGRDHFLQFTAEFSGTVELDGVATPLHELPAHTARDGGIDV